MFNQDSIRSLISQKIIPIPANSFIVWGIISGVMAYISVSSENILDLFLVLSMGSFIGVAFTIWEILKINTSFDLFSLNTNQESIIILLSSLLIFSTYLSITFVEHGLYNYISPVWIFSIGTINHIMGIHYFKKLLRFYGLFLIVSSFVIFGYMLALNLPHTKDLSIILLYIDIILMSLGHILIGAYYKKKQKV